MKKTVFFRFFWGILVAIALYDVLGHLLFTLIPACHYPGHDMIAIAFLLYEISFAGIYTLVKNNAGASALWVILGNKAVKILFAVLLILIYWSMITGPVKHFVIDLVICYFLTIAYETYFFITEKKETKAPNAKTDIK